MPRPIARRLPAVLASLALAGTALAQAPAAPPVAEPAKPTAAPVVTPAPAADETVFVLMKTSQGEIVLELNRTKAPLSVENFLKYANQGYYDGTVFHRVIDGFMIQGGDPTGSGRGGPGYRFADEFHPELQFDRPYLLAMANAGPGTNGSQFFITVGPTPHLTRKHTIFGEVVDPESQQVVDAIATTAVDRNDRPTDDVVIESITIS
jgi:peptidyl-prolyl cis-trans isomerase A (cyclophilin A)